jgi:hypothetical protein
VRPFPAEEREREKNLRDPSPTISMDFLATLACHVRRIKVVGRLVTKEERASVGFCKLPFGVCESERKQLDR